MKTLLKHADILLCQEGKWGVLPNGFLGIDGDTICYIGAEKPREAYETEKEMGGHLLMPGLYNLHTHSSMVLLRGLGSDLPLQRWLEEAMFPIEAKMTQADIDVGSRLAMMELLACGVVSFTDMYDFPQITAARVEEVGMKANLSRPILSFDENESYEQNFRVAESVAFYNEWNGRANGRIVVDFSIHAEYTSHPAIVQRYGQACKEAGARMHLHLSETAKEHQECKARNGKTPARYFYDLGVLDNPTIAAHCVMVEPEDIEILREKGVTAVHNPSSNMKLGSGFMPITEMLQSGVRVALGTDGAASNNNLNMMEEMHLAAVIHNGYRQDATIVPPSQLLTMITANGAAGQGRAGCGALAVGNKADIVAIDLSAPHLMPRHDTPALLVYSAQGADVAMTMVDGKVLYEKGEFKTIDAERVKYDVQEAVKRLM